LPRNRAQASGGRRTYDKPDNASSLRVPAAKLDQFVDLVGELVTVQARLSELAARRDDPEIAAVSEEIERLTSSLRENSMNIRMLPIRATFEKFRRLVHDLARDLGKDVELTIEGADTELDKTVIDQLSDPLMHLIRNSMDHGIEPPECAPRAASGHGDHSSFRAALGRQRADRGSDDGGGIDAEAVRSAPSKRAWWPPAPSSPKPRSSRCSSSPASRPPSRSPTSPAAAWAWTWSGSGSTSLRGTSTWPASRAREPA
jgi:two-component system chemotaxis sensor kinase CheA